MKQLCEDKDGLYAVVFAELKSLGVKVPKLKKFKSNLIKQEKNVSEIVSNKLFGVSLSEQEWISVSGCLVPKFIAAATAYLKKYAQVEIGLFRKAGSVARQRELRSKLENGGSFEECEPNDVASLLKQWLRELPEPVIPSYLHDLFIRCQSLDSDDQRISANLLACLLLPPEHLYTLKHLLNFLSDLASFSGVNKMVPHNLAVIMAPNLLFIKCEHADKVNGTSLMQCYTSLVELLILNADKVGEVPATMTAPLQESNSISKLESESTLSIDLLDFSPSKSRRKRKSGHVQEIVSGIRKFVGNNLTPCKEPPDAKSKPASVSRRAIGSESDISASAAAYTPVRKPTAVAARFLSPWNATNNNNLSSVSGHIRRKSFGLLKRKTRKRVRSPSVSCVPAKKPSPPPVKTADNLPTRTSSETFELEMEKIKQAVTLVSNPIIDDDDDVPNVATNLSSPFLPIPKEKAASESRQNLSAATFPDILAVNGKTKELSDKENVEVEGKVSVLKNNVENSINSSMVLEICEDNYELKKARNVRRSSRQRANTNGVSANHLSNSPNPKLIQNNAKPHSTAKHGSKSNINSNSVQRKRSSNAHKNEKMQNSSRRKSDKLKSESLSAKNCNEEINTVTESFKQDVNETQVSKNDSNTSSQDASTPEKSTGFKRKGTYKSSLKRGRPNTVKTGLKSELCPKYSADLVKDVQLDVQTTCILDLSSDNVKNEKIATDQKSVSTILHTNISASKDNLLQQSEKQIEYNECRTALPDILSSCCRPNFNSQPENIVNDSLSFNIHIDLNKSSSSNSSSTPANSKPLTRSASKQLQLSNVSIELEHNNDSFVKCTINGLSKTCSCENLNSICKHKKTKKFNSSLELHRTNSTPSPSVKINIENSLNISSENVFEDASQKTESDNEKWMCAQKFFNRNLMLPDNQACKRESIVQLMVKNAGKVQASVQRYDSIVKNPTANTPAKQPKLVKKCKSNPVRNASYRNKFNDSPEYTFASPTLHGSLKNKSVSSKPTRLSLNEKNTNNQVMQKTPKYRKSPIPPPPKFFVTETDILSPVTSYPLKEVTNTNINKDETTSKMSRMYDGVPLVLESENSPIIVKNVIKTERKKNDSSIYNNSKKLSRHSFTGYHSNKVNKACRSESSPALSNQFRRQSGHLKHSPRQRSSRRYAEQQSQLFIESPLASEANTNANQSFHNSSILGNDTFAQAQMIDEWQCDM